MPAETSCNLDKKINGYGPGHPWYYVLGGPILFPSEIMGNVKIRHYQGYMANEISKANSKPEPQRSEILRALKGKVLADLLSDLSYYRALACKLREFRRDTPCSEPPSCKDIHVSISLKHNHAYNGFAHLNAIEELLSRQGDLFD